MNLVNFMIAFNAVMPLLIYLIVGQIIGRIGWMNQKSLQELNQLIFKLLLPMNLMMNIYNTDLSSSFRPDVVVFGVGFTITIFIIYAIIIAFIEKDSSKQGVMLQGAVRSNFVLFGLPIAVSLLDGRDIGMTTILIAFLVPLNNVLSIIALSIYQDQRLDIRQLILAILKNPMFIGTMIGLIIRLLGIQFPSFIETAFTGMTASITPIALMVMGGTFNFRAINQSLRQLTFTTIFRLIVTPLIGLTIAILLGFRDENLIPFIIFFGGPTAVSSYTMAQNMGGDADLASQIVIVTTGLSMITLMFFITVTKSMGLI